MRCARQSQQAIVSPKPWSAIQRLSSQHMSPWCARATSGKLDGVLRAIVEDRTRRELLNERFSAAIRYPMFLVASAILILLFFLIYVVPQFEPVFKDLGGRLNSGAAIVLGASDWLRTNLDA